VENLGVLAPETQLPEITSLDGLSGRLPLSATRRSAVTARMSQAPPKPLLPNQRIKSLTGPSSPRFAGVPCAGQLDDVYACGHACTRVNCN
jgi:hypothetical protein